MLSIKHLNHNKRRSKTMQYRIGQRVTTTKGERAIVASSPCYDKTAKDYAYMVVIPNRRRGMRTAIATTNAIKPMR